MTVQPYEILYSLKGDVLPSRVATKTSTKIEALSYCHGLRGPLPQAIHFVITHEDGRTIWDTRKDGLIWDNPRNSAYDEDE